MLLDCATCPQRQADVDDLHRTGAELHRRILRGNRVNVALLSALLLALAGSCYLLVTHEGTRETVQVVQVDEAQQLRLVEPRQELLAWQPGDGIWITMIGDWIERVRKRGLPRWQSEHDWHWARLHTCKPAQDYLSDYAAREKPHNPGNVTVQVELSSVVKSDRPETWTAFWTERRWQGSLKIPETTWTGMFTVGRVKPKGLQIQLYNPLGLCIAHYDWKESKGVTP